MGSRLPALGCVLLLAAGSWARAAQPLPDSNAYAGSSTCGGCHTSLFERWQETRHARSILTARQARQAGYPLPQQRLDGPKLDVNSWEDALFVFGGKQRVAYIDRAGRVVDAAFHHRLGEWRSFPHEPLASCGSCHATAAEQTGSGPVDVTWEEPVVGCEACHGPGARHGQTLIAEDIRVDPSPRSCGRCHTLTGAVLPRDDKHLTHDFVQAWHRDPHFTGVSRNSHDGFCARCHSPYEGVRGDYPVAAAKRVFSETKHGISCVSCHDPHQLSNRAYAEGKFQPIPPQVSRRYLHEGNDGDFTTVDYREVQSTDASCVACHQGADRIELNHGNAGCNDCHVTFQRNRSPASVVIHDANYPTLGCRQCHADADHLMTILFSDPDFLETRHIHNLRTLPQSVVERYGFRYRELPADIPQRRTLKSAPYAGNKTASSGLDDRAQRKLAVPPGSVGADPPRIEDLLSEATRAHDAGNLSEAERLIVQASQLDDTWSFFSLDADAASRTHLESLKPLALSDDTASAWLDAYLDLTSGRVEDVRVSLGAREGNLPPPLAYLAGIAALMANDWEPALAYFDTVLVHRPDALAPRLARAVVELTRNRLAHGLAELTAVRAEAPNHPIVSYLIGWAHLRRGDAQAAIPDLERAAALAPEFDGAFLALAHAHESAGHSPRAMEVYKTLIQRNPSLQPAHARLGQLFEHLAEQVFFRLHELRDESPDGLSRSTVETFERQRNYFEESALAELGLAVRLDVSDVESTREIGEILRRRNELDDARVIFESLLRRHPEQWLLYYRLGTIAIARDDLPYAVTALIQALQLAPAEGDSYQALGIALLRLGSPADAETALVQGSRHQPFNPALHNNLGVARARTGNLEGARASFDRALELGTFPLPRRYITHHNLALVHLALGDATQARLSLQRALRARPDFQPAKDVMARVESGWRSSSSSEYILHDLLELFGEVNTVAVYE